MSRIAKHIQTETKIAGPRIGVFGEDGENMLMGVGFLCGDKNILNLVVVIVLQLCECTKTIV